eukprot:TRINITY_DN12666_c0_g1_i1.p1 TRINITY_DN12666_c0_g1~~TRINITY_DN12666_c0_g1_i1.p1  ORF type:complete len:227 (+),score=21.47 TRINITY_DN12666_c0_g1_i1:105-785(+)
MNISEDLNSYLKKSTSTPSLSSLSSKLKLPTFKTPFGAPRSEDEEPFIESQDVESGERSGGSWFPYGGGPDKSAEKSWFPALSKKQRIFGFMTSLILGIICFGLASAYIPFIVLKARKFSLLFSLGSLFTITSFSFLYGPWNHVRHLFSKDRLPFTLIYFLSLAGTLYFAMGLQSTVLTCIAAVAQIVALVWFIVSYVPGGQTGLKFFSKLCSGLCRSSVTTSLPI